jgi:hypothetical protein
MCSLANATAPSQWSPACPCRFARRMRRSTTSSCQPYASHRGHHGWLSASAAHAGRPRRPPVHRMALMDKQPPAPTALVALDHEPDNVLDAALAETPSPAPFAETPPPAPTAHDAAPSGEPAKPTVPASLGTEGPPPTLQPPRSRGCGSASRSAVVRQAGQGAHQGAAVDQDSLQAACLGRGILQRMPLPSAHMTTPQTNKASRDSDAGVSQRTSLPLAHMTTPQDAKATPRIAAPIPAQQAAPFLDGRQQLGATADRGVVRGRHPPGRPG